MNVLFQSRHGWPRFSIAEIMAAIAAIAACHGLAGRLFSGLCGYIDRLTASGRLYVLGHVDYRKRAGTCPRTCPASIRPKMTLREVSCTANVSSRNAQLGGKGTLTVDDCVGTRRPRRGGMAIKRIAGCEFDMRKGPFP